MGAVAAVALAAFTPAAMAQLHAGDIAVGVQNGALATGRVTQLGQPELGFRVFLANFGEAPNFTNDPGMDSIPGTFPSGTGVGFNIRRALRVWSGSDFAAIPPETLRIALGRFGPVFTPTTDVLTPGFTMTANALGEFHHHPGVTLQAPAADGIYLYETELFTTMAGVANSPPFWIVYRQGGDASAQLAAADWVVRFRANPCPADLNLDGETTFDDVQLFIGLYNAGNSGVDGNVDGELTFDDIQIFIARYNAGC
jgi:hypothetical protein